MRELAATMPERAPPLGAVLAALGGIYVGQSLIGGITFQAVPAVLRQGGAPLGLIGLVSLVMLPWAVKFLWAPRVERLRRPVGSRPRSRGLIVPGQMLTAALLVIAATIDPVAAPGALLAVLAAAALVAATTDIAGDGYAIEQLRPAARGWGNMMQVGGGYLGALIGGALCLVLVARLGWQASLLAMAGIVVLLALPVLAVREGAAAVPAAGPRPSLGVALASPAVRRGLLTVLLFQVGLRTGQGLVGPFLVDRGLDLAMIGVLLGAAGTGAALLGTLAAALLLRRHAPDGLLPWALAAQALMLAGLLAAAAAPGMPVAALAALVLVKGAVGAAGFVVLYSAMMGWSSPSQPGVDFTLMQCADAAVAATCGLGGGVLAQHFGYGASFGLACAWAAGASLALRALTLRALTRREAP